ncbi:acetyltransferase [Xylariomycetidae sp. FL2044]|nr:acetyltransferase [Xylariomycetidae sp. FL2044]
MAHVARDLDINACYGYGGHDTMMGKMNVVPGLKTSTAFFTFLRANLVVNPSAVSTPNMEPASSQLLPSPSPSPLVTLDPLANSEPAGAAEPVLDDLPPLSVGVIGEKADKVDALKLVTDSIAQQRQTASLHLIFHPYALFLLAIALALAYRYSWHGPRGDLGLALLVHSAVVMTYLLTVRYLTGQYVQVAEDTRWDWLVSPETGEEDTVIGVRFGKDLIGTLVLRLEPRTPLSALSSTSTSTGTPSSPNPTYGHQRKRSRRQHDAALRGGKGVIRAWTVKLRYRGQGVGRDMLHEAVRMARERCGRDAAVGFAREHANSVAVLPEALSGYLRRGEQRAAKALEAVLGEWGGGRKKRTTKMKI